LGACRAEGTQIAPPTQKDCRWDLCTASTGESVATQDGCKQACLDDPSGTCVSYSHSDNGYCVIHGPLVHTYSEHTNEQAESGESWVDIWDVRDRELKFCLGNVPNNPPGCEDSNTAKPNPAYMCQTLKTNPERWMAYGPKGEPKDLHVTIGVTGSSVEELENSKMNLQTIISDLAFWHSDLTTTDSIKDDGEGQTDINFILQVDSTSAPPMMTLLQRQFDWATAPPKSATDSSEATEGGVGYFNAVMADAFPSGAQLVDFEISITNPKEDSGDDEQEQEQEQKGDDEKDSLGDVQGNDEGDPLGDVEGNDELDPLGDVEGKDEMDPLGDVEGNDERNPLGEDEGLDDGEKLGDVDGDEEGEIDASTSMIKNLAVGGIVSTLLSSFLAF